MQNLIEGIIFQVTLCLRVRETNTFPCSQIIEHATAACMTYYLD